MLAEHFLDRGERSFRIVAFKFFEMIARIARIGDLLWMQLARDVGHYILRGPRRSRNQAGGACRSHCCRPAQATCHSASASR